MGDERGAGDRRLRPRGERLVQRHRRARLELQPPTLDAEIRFASPAERNEFTNELTSAFANLIRKYHHADAAEGRTFRLIGAVYPAVPQLKGADHAESQTTN